MRAGRLRQRVALQSKTYTAANAYGEEVVAWSTQDTVWAAIEPLTGREYFAQQQVQAESTTRIVVRYRGDIDETWRVKHTDHSTSPATVRYFDIVNVQNENFRDRMLVLMTREGLSEDQAEVSSQVLYDADGNPLEFVGGDEWEVVA